MDTPADKLFKACQYGNLSEVRTIINSGECSVNVLDQVVDSRPKVKIVCSKNIFRFSDGAKSASYYRHVWI